MGRHKHPPLVLKDQQRARAVEDDLHHHHDDAGVEGGGSHAHDSKQRLLQTRVQQLLSHRPSGCGDLGSRNCKKNPHSQDNLFLLLGRCEPLDQAHVTAPKHGQSL
jgi:hypothetical protein